jgi:hypothetical protein
MRFGDTSVSIGSGVLYRRGEKTFIVTAWHNLTGKHPYSLKSITTTLAIPDNVVATVLSKFFTSTNLGYVRQSYKVPLYMDRTPLYRVHPKTWPRVDVAAIPINLDAKHDLIGRTTDGDVVRASLPLRSAQPNGVGSDLETITDFEQVSPGGPQSVDNLSVTQELFIPGYPKGVADQEGNPVWKRATIATAPGVTVGRTAGSFMIDCASREGMSGAPVLYYNKGGTTYLGSMTVSSGGSVTGFCGIYTGRIGPVSEFEAQIGTVWERRLVDEICDYDITPAHSEDLELPSNQVRRIIEAEWPGPDYAAEVLAPGSFVARYFASSMMEKIDGGADPENVLRQIMEYAKTLEQR